MKLNLAIVSTLVALPVVATTRAGEPQRRATLAVALDDSAASQMLRAELSRDWLHANPNIVLSKRQQADLAVIGRNMQAIQGQLFAQFAVVFVESGSVPFPERLHLPAVRINRGRWESLDRRAFAFETRPLLTLDWYRARYAALYDREASLDTLADNACRDEGYSGSVQVETPPPWER